MNIPFLTVARTLVVVLLSSAAPVYAQKNPISDHQRRVYGVLSMILVRAADKMPAEKYGFKPVETVRPFGDVVAHIAETQYFFCSAALGEKKENPKIEKTGKTKAELISALNEAISYCNKAYGSMTDEKASELIVYMREEAPRVGPLMVNQMHSLEHYGNLVTYLRMNDIVPPSSEPEFMKQFMPKKK